MTDLISTYADCALCGRICRGQKVVPRAFANESTEDQADGRTIALRVKDSRYPTWHRRPVCSECAETKAMKAAVQEAAA